MMWRAGLLSPLGLVIAACAQPLQPPEAAANRVELVQQRAQVHFELAITYFRAGQLQTALASVQKAMAADPAFDEGYHLRALVHMGLGNSADAESDFQRALQSRPKDGALLNNYGWFLCERNRYQESVAAFELSVIASRDIARPLIGAGICSMRVNRVDEAQAFLVRARQADPGNILAAVELARLHFRRNEFDAARAQLGELNRSPRATAESLWLEARITHHMGLAKERNALTDALLQKYPRSPEAAAFERGSLDG